MTGGTISLTIWRQVSIGRRERSKEGAGEEGKEPEETRDEGMSREERVLSLRLKGKTERLQDEIDGGLRRR